MDRVISVLDYSVLTANAVLPSRRTPARSPSATPRSPARNWRAPPGWIGETSAALLECYVPLETQELLTRHLEDKPDQSVVVIHDRGGSLVPWEVLHFGNRCPAIEAGLSRRFMASSPAVRARSNLPPNAIASRSARGGSLPAICSLPSRKASSCRAVRGSRVQRGSRCSSSRLSKANILGQAVDRRVRHSALCRPCRFRRRRSRPERGALPRRHADWPGLCAL